MRDVRGVSCACYLCDTQGMDSSRQPTFFLTPGSGSMQRDRFLWALSIVLPPQLRGSDRLVLENYGAEQSIEDSGARSLRAWAVFYTV